MKPQKWTYECVDCHRRFASYCDDLGAWWRCPECDAKHVEPYDPLADVDPAGLPDKVPVKIKGYYLRPGEFDQMVDEQEGKCAVCGRAPLGARGLVVDHNHRTGEVRGLLCAPCNTGLGLLQDDPDLLVAAAAYLTLRGNYAGMKRTPFPGTPHHNEGAK